MGARSYDDEEYLPWYRQPTPTWLELSAAARGVLVSVAMTLNYRTGEVHLRKGLPSLATLLRLPWSDLEPALSELLSAGKLEWDEERAVLRDPEFMGRSRRGRTSAERTRDWRARKRDGVTSRDGGDVTRVTPVTVTAVTQIDQIRSDPPKPPGSDAAARRVDSGTPLATEIVSAYEDAVSSVTGNVFALSGPGPRADLLTAVNRHAPPRLPSKDVPVWLAALVDEWMRQHRGRETFTGNWSPKHFLGWLNGGRKPPDGVQMNGGASARARKELT